MTKIIYFITPKTIVTVGSKVGTKATEFIPVLGPLARYTKNAKKITNLSDPVSSTSRCIGVMFNYCFGKTGAMTIECLLWITLSTAGGLTCNPTLIAGGAEFGNILLEEILN